MITVIITSFILIITFALGFIVLKNNYKSLTNKSFFFVTTLSVAWAIANFLENENLSYFLRKLFLRLDFFTALFDGYAWLLFALIFLSDVPKFKDIRFRFLSLLPALIFSPLTFSDLIINNVRISQYGISFDWGILFLPYALVILGYFLGSLYILFRKYKKFIGLKRVQTLYILVGLSISSILALVINLVLQNYITIDISRIGIYSFIFVFIFTSYAILKYRLMDIRVIIRRSAVFAVLVIIITSVYALFAYLISLYFTQLIGASSVILNGILTAIFIAIGFEPLKKWLSLVTDKYLFKAPYNPEEVLSEFSDKLASTLDLQELSQFLVSRLEQIFKSSIVALFLLNEEKNEYERTAFSGKIKERLAKIDQKLFNKVSKGLQSLNKTRDIIVKEEIKKINEQLKNPVIALLIRELEKYDVSLIAPLYQREKLVGILFMGDKKSGDVYSAEDLRVLEIISAQAAVAMQNSKLFEEQKKFAIHLKKEVEKATQKLKIANVQLKKLDRAKSEFISIASHQLRTPLTAIKGYISMINQGDFGPLTKKLAMPLDRVYKSTERIIHLVEDLLNISRIESGRMKYDFSRVSLEEMIEDVYDELKQQAANKGLKFEFIKPKKKIPEIILDKGKIREVVMNLVDNAVKYTPKGSVILKLDTTDNYVQFSVSDTGRGIGPDEMPLLFQKFSRARGVQLENVEGTGLGLYIARQIIKRHGGKIWAESAGRGKGSTFIIQFKIKNKKLEQGVEKQK
jgi:signal transduction histidine kinase